MSGGYGGKSCNGNAEGVGASTWGETGGAWGTAPSPNGKTGADSSGNGGAGGGVGG
jgi:hypothetical protein